MTISVYLDNGLKVGEVEGDTYYTMRKPEHFMKMFQGFGISVSILNRLNQMGVKKVFISYMGVNGVIRYSCFLSQYLESDKKCFFEDKLGKLNGDEEQKFVSKKDMKEIGKETQEEIPTYIDLGIERV